MENCAPRAAPKAQKTELGTEDKVIPYAGEMKAHFIAAFGDSLYFSEQKLEWNGGESCLYRMKISEGTVEKLPAEPEEGMEFTRIVTDAEGCLHVMLQESGKEYNAYDKSQIWKHMEAGR